MIHDKTESVRLDRTLLKKVRAQAVQQGRSIKSQIEHCIRQEEIMRKAQNDGRRSALIF